MKDKDHPQEIIRRLALKWLARRDYSCFELTQKLKAKKYQGSDIDEVITELLQNGFINENRFLQNYIYWRRQKGVGPLRILGELKSKGIAQGMIAEELKITDNSWFTDAYRVWQKHFKAKGYPDDFKQRAKQMHFLHYRGFTPEQIEAVMEKCSLDGPALTAGEEHQE